MMTIITLDKNWVLNRGKVIYKRKKDKERKKD